MTKADDEYGKRVLAPLQPAPPLDPQISAGEKARFLLEAENFRQGFVPGVDSLDKQQEHGMSMESFRKRPMSLLKALVAALIALFVLLGSNRKTPTCSGFRTFPGRVGECPSTRGSDGRHTDAKCAVGN